MKNTELKTLKEMMESPKNSDRAIAKNVGVSQPTITRTRAKLQKEGIIESYQIIPNLGKLGFEIIAFSVVDNENRERVANDERVIYAVGVSEGTLIVSIHANYTDYYAFARGYDIEDSSISVTAMTPVKPLSFANIPL